MAKNNKILWTVVLVLAVALIFQAGYFLGKIKRTGARRISKKEQQRLAGDPFVEMQKMHRKMDRMFSEYFRRMMHHPDFNALQRRFSFEPDIDVAEKKNEYVVMVDLPGVDKETINVEIKGNILTISGERSIEVEDATREGFFMAERNFGSFSRTITLPEEIKADKVTAESKEGMLIITLPKETKREEGQQPRIKIEVE
ncbi:MAG: Hsp20/alpha crystallin family protein [Candidatus Omnitrophota bacterium]|jgi:HSP20 family protein